MPVSTIYLSLGSNLGHRAENLQLALNRLRDDVGFAIERTSSIYETEPQDVLDQPWFLNLVLKGSTHLSPTELLTCVLKVEADLGRVREGAVPKGPRAIDIDILLIGDSIINQPELQVPHPRVRQRRFVLEPLVEINPELLDPTNSTPYRNYLNAVSDQMVRKFWKSTNQFKSD